MESAETDPSPADAAELVRVTVPARTEFLQLLRLVVAGFAGDVCTVEEIDDLKIAIEELAAVVMATTSDPRPLDVTFRVDADRIIVTGTIAADDPRLEPSEFLATILDAVVDRHELEADDRQARFRFEKRIRGR